MKKEALRGVQWGDRNFLAGVMNGRTLLLMVSLNLMKLQLAQGELF